LQPLDVRLLEFLYAKQEGLHIPKYRAHMQLRCRDTAALVSVDHLVDLGCVLVEGGDHYLNLTALGIELNLAVEA
jgi:hypothetical protein